MPHEPTEASTGLRVLLDEPARRLPELLPAWKNASRLAARLGDRPLARPVHAGHAETWLDELRALPTEPLSDTTGGDQQLTFEQTGRGSRR